MKRVTTKLMSSAPTNHHQMLRGKRGGRPRGGTCGPPAAVPEPRFGLSSNQPTAFSYAFARDAALQRSLLRVTTSKVCFSPGGPCLCLSLVTSTKLVLEREARSCRRHDAA